MNFKIQLTTFLKKSYKKKNFFPVGILNVLRKDQKNQILLTSLTCFIYGYAISINSLILNNVSTIMFITTSLFLFLKSKNLINKPSLDENALRFLLITTFSINLFLILGTAVAAPKESLFWVVDSYDMHIPGSIKIMNIILGKTSFKILRSSIYDRTYLAHIFGALSFAIFGVTHIASALSLIIPKLICAYYIYKGTKQFLGAECANIATLLYSFLPTVIFYTTAFYKEATLQMLIAIILYLIIRLYQEPKIKDFLLILPAFILLGNERHYLLPCFALSAIAFSLLSKKLKTSFKFAIFLTCIISYFVFKSYYYDIEPQKLITQLQTYRGLYLSYADVMPINKDISYPFAILKFLFTPFLTIVKLKTYSHYATLITWGSFLHHLLIIFFGITIWQFLKKKIHRRLIIILTIPFCVFLLIFGYVAPYNGRLRDSFMPLIVMIASYSIATIRRRQKPTHV